MWLRVMPKTAADRARLDEGIRHCADGYNFSRPRLTMVLQPGERIGPYEILALLDKGGMGEVYRAATKGSAAKLR